MIIMGIDPGLNATGYGIIDADARYLHVMMAGDIRPPKRQPLAQRLAFIHDALGERIDRFHPKVAVLEKIFTHHSYVTTASLMAHARGVVCLTVQELGVTLAEYPPTQVKKSLTGNGAASKEQVARMVAQWLRYSDPSWSRDATDALALAIIHARIGPQTQRLAGVA